MTGLDKAVLGVWARREPDAAWAWFLQEQATGGENPDGGPERYLPSLFGALASSDIAAACARMRQLSPHDQFAAAQGMTGVTSRDPRTRDALLAAAADFDLEVRQMVYQNVACNWVISDPDAATAWLETLPAADRKSVTEKAGTTMLMVDPPRAAELLVRNAGENYVSLGAAYSIIGTQWGSRNPRAAAEWINQQPPSKALDYARMSFAAQFLDRDADAAFAWASAITSESRYSMLQGMYEQLHKRMRPAPSRCSRAPACRPRWSQKSARASPENDSAGAPHQTIAEKLIFRQPSFPTDVVLRKLGNEVAKTSAFPNCSLETREKTIHLGPTLPFRGRLASSWFHSLPNLQLGARLKSTLLIFAPDDRRSSRAARFRPAPCQARVPRGPPPRRRHYPAHKRWQT
jgi:hypothetical protein